MHPDQHVRNSMNWTVQPASTLKAARACLILVTSFPMCKEGRATWRQNDQLLHTLLC